MLFAKKWVLIVLAIGIAVSFIACGNDEPNPLTTVTADNADEVLTDIYDDNNSTVYIKVDEPYQHEDDATVAKLMIKKRKWEEKNPNKKVVAMTVVTNDGTINGFSAVIGLLIHYERR